MNKYAAEKIAQEYYALGIEIALQRLHGEKTAGLNPIKFKRLVSTPSAALAALYSGGLAGGAAGFKGISEIPAIAKAMQMNSLDDLAFLGASGALVGGTTLGAGLGASLAGKGAVKLLNKHAPIERYLDLGVARLPLGKVRL